MNKISKKISKDERDEHGYLTDMALAVEALEDHGCDCGTDEQGTCLVCRCEVALESEREKVLELESQLEDQIERLCAIVR